MLSISAAATVTLDFEGLAINDSRRHSIGGFYEEDGFGISSSYGRYGLKTTGTQHQNYSGSTALYNNSAKGITSLRQLDGNAFSIFSIDLTELMHPARTKVTFTGEKLSGVTEEVTFKLDGDRFSAETFFFSSFFNDVTLVSWVQKSPYHQFDNIILGTSVSAVPLPAALPLYGAGIAILGFFGWRHKKKQA